MKRMNYIWIYFLVLFQFVSTVSAQEVTTVGGYPVINLSAMATLRTSITDPSLKYQVMCSDLNGTKMNWDTAVSNCKSYRGEGGSAGGWRLPTQCELQMIWILHPQFKGDTSFKQFNSIDYWSSTEYATGIVWYINFGNGFVNNNYKTNSYYVRCVRDI